MLLFLVKNIVCFTKFETISFKMDVYSEIKCLREPPQENNHISYFDILNVHKPEQKTHVLKFPVTGFRFVE